MKKEFLLKDLVIKHVRLKKQKEQKLEASKVKNSPIKIKEATTQLVFFLLMILGLSLMEVIKLPALS